MTQRDSLGQWRVYTSPDGEAVPWPTNYQPLLVIPPAPPGEDFKEWTRRFWTEGRNAMASMEYQTRRSVATFTEEKMEGELWGGRHDLEVECAQEEYDVLLKSPEAREGSPKCVKRVKSASTGLFHAHSFTHDLTHQLSSPPPSFSSRRIFTTPPRLRHPSLSSVVSPEDAMQRGLDMSRHGSLASVATFMSTPGPSSPKKRRAPEADGAGRLKGKGEKTSPREWVRVCEWIDAKVAEDGYRSTSQLSRDACDYFESLPEDQYINFVANTCRSHYITGAEATRKHESLAYGTGKDGSLLDIINQERRALGFAPLMWHGSPAPPLGSLLPPQLDQYGNLRPDTAREIQQKFSRLAIETQQKIINEADSRRWARAILAEPKVTVDQRMRMNLWVDEQRPLRHWAKKDAAQAAETYFRSLPEPHRIISSHADCFLSPEGRRVLEHMALKRCSPDNRHAVLQGIVAAETGKLREAEKAIRHTLPPSTPLPRETLMPASPQTDRSSGDFGDVTLGFIDPRALWRMSLEPEKGV
ncbi:hypothetical protein IAT38_000911 [Cryptococcus sp. DSM 104549]